MTIAISVKVHDGIVLAADSATTLVAIDPAGQSEDVINVYNNANKIFNLYKGLPIAGMTFGSGSIGNASISTLAKDLRERFAGRDCKDEGWKLNPDTYTMADVAKATRRFLFEENYEVAFKDVPVAERPAFGFMIAGYSAHGDLAEEWNAAMVMGGVCPQPEMVRPKENPGISWSGNTEAIGRLLNGYAPGLPHVLTALGVPQDQINQAMPRIQAALAAPLVNAAMPIQDVIDLAEFLVHTAIMFSRFAPGASTVGGPIEIAAITKHEGFRWVKRKHYYDRRHNPLLGEVP